MNSLILYILGVNAITFLLMRIDKQKAVKDQYRIPEHTFWLLSILGGAIGSYAGMKMFHHKTKHPSFTIGMPLLIVVNIIQFAYLFSA